MNSGRLIAIIAFVFGFGIAALAGLFFAVQTAAGELSSGGLIVGAFVAFIVVAPIFGFGVYMFVQASKEDVRESAMAKQRRLLDIVRTRGQVELHDLAIELGSSVDEVKTFVYDLVGMQVFSGYVNWDKGVLYSSDASKLRDLNECENCGAPISLAGKGVIACQYCGTEYFLP